MKEEILKLYQKGLTKIVIYLYSIALVILQMTFLIDTSRMYRKDSKKSLEDFILSS